ncbi:2-Methylisocitrate lyase, PEP mutase family [Mucilaginibacter mallensis]|uniref:2-Methylisocitrate lyase, PEP mutase family n=1 Tax=Mucilaginibacter mallensis TaxID=652787 RepID=A0A1H1U1B3_MUCMA|nr:isocitrate lyase/phosphoenolpyruvate mutase family protein [Mucilaginibacter mallensis]SDS66355.1 2-Methylisocitrate lyase, PEP mutase family [Mucilaginibacter mallensis]
MNNYETFYQLHQQKKPLIIANAWNAKSAQIIEKSGFEVVATSSGAIAASMGYPDGEQMPFAEMLYIISRIKAATGLPLSVDFERGYTDDLTLLNEHVQQLIDIGAVGINMEDNQGEELYLRKLSSIKNYLLKTGQKLFINARTDGFLQNLDSPLETTIRRAELYKDAGADGLFVTGIQDTDLIRQIVLATSLPVNLVGASKQLSIGSLADLGVKRISMAGILFSAGYKKIEGILTTIKAENSLSGLFSAS